MLFIPSPHKISLSILPKSTIYSRIMRKNNQTTNSLMNVGNDTTWKRHHKITNHLQLFCLFFPYSATTPLVPTTPELVCEVGTWTVDFFPFCAVYLQDKVGPCVAQGQISAPPNGLNKCLARLLGHPTQMWSHQSSLPFYWYHEWCD